MFYWQKVLCSRLWSPCGGWLGLPAGRHHGHCISLHLGQGQGHGDSQFPWPVQLCPALILPIGRRRTVALVFWLMLPWQVKWTQCFPETLKTHPVWKEYETISGRRYVITVMGCSHRVGQDCSCLFSECHTGDTGPLPRPSPTSSAISPDSHIDMPAPCPHASQWLRC